MQYLLQILAGLALFLFGVEMLGEAMEKLAGDRLQVWLDRVTDRPLKGALFGAVATALTQSSSLLMVTMIGLVNANLMSLGQAVGVMMGQEIGTTLTAQIAAFKVGDLCFVFVILGFAMIEFTGRDRWRTYGEILLGIGLLFLGMKLMSGALSELAEAPQVSAWLAAMTRNWFAGVLAGAVATAAVQSSSAITGLLVAMGLTNTISLPGAIAVLLGANIGTCVTGLIASARLSRAARRTSVAQVLINIVGVLLFLPVLAPFTELVSRTSQGLARQIANAHTIFNVVVSLVLFPFVGQITRFVERLVPEPKRAPKLSATAHIDERLLRIPQVAIREALRELLRIGDVTVMMVEKSGSALLTQDLGAAQWVLDQELSTVDPVSRALETYVNSLLQTNISAEQQRRCLQIKNLATDIERIGDLAENLAEAAQQRVQHGIVFSSVAKSELSVLCEHTQRTLVCGLSALRDRDRAKAEEACLLESEFDGLYLQARQGHIARLDEGVCQPEADVLFVESLRNLERICDHADNIGVSVQRN